MEKTLRQSELKYRRLHESMTEAVATVNMEGHIIEFNPAFQALLGYSDEELLRLTFEDLTPEQWHASEAKIIKEQVLQRGYSVVYEKEYLRQDGTILPVELRTFLLRDNSNHPAGMWAIVREIAERKRAENALREAKQLYETIFNLSPEMIVLTTEADGRYIAVNATHERYTGYRADEVIGHTVAEFGVWESPAARQKVIQSLKARGIINNVEINFHGKTGELYTALLSMTRVVVGGENCLISIVTDITERKRTEEAVLKLSQAVEQSPASIIITDIQGNIEFVNPKFTQITGYEREEVLGKNPRILKTNHTPKDEYQRLWAAITSGKVWHGEFLNKKKNGELFWEDATISPIINSAGVITNYLAIKEDITQRKNLEAQLFQAQKMEAIGQLAGGVAHDFNNILSAIIGYGNLVKMKLPADDPVQLNLDQLLESAQRAAQLTHSLLAFSRKQVMNLQPVKLNEIISRLEKFLRRIIGEDVELTITLRGDTTVLADSVQIQQVLMNLAANARDAMPKGGSLTIETDIVKLSDEVAQTHGLEKPGCYVVISVADSGAGMNEETRKRIFEPFFTTKEMGRGTGLGLSIAYGIIKQHKGDIRVYSRIEAGTTFKIYLPVYLIPVEHYEETKKSDVVIGGTETVLIAEDDVDLRKFFTGVLVDYGYSVIVAEDGNDAVEKFSQHKDTIGLCILDMIMPRKSGMEVYEEIKKQLPEIKVIFLSGYTADKIQREGIPSGCKLIQKPVSPQVLLKQMREALDRK